MSSLANVSGKLVLPDGSAPPAGSFVQLDLKNYGTSTPTADGVAIYNQKVFNISTTDGSWSGTLYRNDAISVNGSFPTYWAMTYFSGGRSVYPAKFITVSQASADLDTLTALNPGSIPSALPQPLTGAQSKLQAFPLAASTWTTVHNFGTQAVVASFYDSNWNQIIPDTAVATDVNTFTGTFLQPQAGFMVVVNVGNWTPSVSNPNYIIGNPTSSQSVSGDFPFTFGGSVSAKRIENVRYADQFPGATADAKINAALADLGGSGTVYARGFGATTQSIAATVTLAAGQTLICDPATTFQPSSNALTLFNLMVNSRLDGATVDVTNLSGAFSGKVFALPDNYANGNNTILENFRVLGSGTSAAGTAVYLHATSPSQSVTFTTVRHGRIWGLQTALSLSAVGGGFVNGNVISDIAVTDSVIGLDMESTDATAGTAVSGNIISGYNYQQGAHTSFSIKNASSAGESSYNVIVASIWDGAPVSFTGAVANRNIVSGDINGTWTNATGTNYLFDNFQGRFFFGTQGQAQFPIGIIIGNSNSLLGFQSDGTTTRSLAQVTGSNVIALGDANVGLFFSGTSFNLNGTGTFNASNNPATWKTLGIGGGTTLSRYARYTPTLSPASVAANTTAEQTFTNVLTSGDVVVGVSKPTAQAGLGIVGWRASGTSLLITFSNNTASPITPTASEVYQVVAVQ